MTHRLFATLLGSAISLFLALGEPPAFASCAGAPEDAIVMRPTADTRIMQSHPDANDGAAGLVWIRRSAPVRGLVGFDLSCQQAAVGALDCAQLEVSLEEAIPKGGTTLAAHAMNVDWVEGNQIFNPYKFQGANLGAFPGSGPGTNWVCRVLPELASHNSSSCDPGDLWNGGETCDGGTCYEPATSYAYFDTRTQAELSWDLTPDVALASGEASWLIKVVDESQTSGHAKFYTREGAEHMATTAGSASLFDLAPRLLVWSPAAAAPEVTLLSPGPTANENPARIRVAVSGSSIGASARWENRTTGAWGWLSHDMGNEWIGEIPVVDGANDVELTAFDGCGTEGKNVVLIEFSVPPLCGNGVLDPGEDCDDGNNAGGDCCAGACVLEANGSTCEDGSPCTIADSCSNGTCASGPPAPSACGNALLCYSAKGTKDAPKFQRIEGVTLSDEFGSGSFDLRKVHAVCVVGEIDGEPAVAPDVHALAYSLRPNRTSAPVVGPVEIEVTDRFGTRPVETDKAASLLTPSGLILGAPATPPDPTIANRYLCYRASTPGAPNAPQPVLAQLNDLFDDRTYWLRKLVRLCSPADGAGGGVENSDAYLTCYKVSLAPGQPKHEKIENLIQVSDALSMQQLDTKRPTELCVPARVTAGGR